MVYLAEHTDPIDILLSQDDSGLVTAQFEWPTAPPEETYTMELSEAASLELDAAFPVRPARLLLHDATHHPSLARIDQLFGEDFRSICASMTSIGLCATKIVLSKRQRHAIAEAQLAAPSTPEQIRRTCGFILRSAVPKLT